MYPEQVVKTAYSYIVEYATQVGILVQELQDRPVVANLKDVTSKISIAELQIGRDHSNIPLGTKSSSKLWPQIRKLDCVRFVRREQLCPSEERFQFSSRCVAKVVSSQRNEGGMIKFTGMSKSLQRGVVNYIRTGLSGGGSLPAG